MKRAIGFNAATLSGEGSRMLGQSLFKALERLTDRPIEVWMPRSWGWSRESARRGVRFHEVSGGAKGKALAEWILVREAAHAGRLGVVLSLGDTGMPACPVPQITLVQLAYLAETRRRWGFRPSPRFGAKLLLLHGYFACARSTVTHYTVQSEYMRDGLVRKWNIAPDRISVIPSALVDDALSLIPYQDRGEYICYVATASEHKNHEVLPSLVQALRARGIELRCKITAGEEELPGVVNEARRLGVVEAFDFLGRLSRSECMKLTANAKVAVIPSLLESFGFSYFEAMAAGVPLVVADVPAARDACGVAALYAHPRSGADFATRVAELLGSRSLWQEHVDRGLARYEQKRWTWDRVAAAYLELISAVETGRNPMGGLECQAGLTM